MIFISPINMVAEQTEKTIYKTVDKTQKIKTPLEDK